MRKVSIFGFAFLISIFSIASNVFATTIFSANSTGGEKNLFYTNETVYVYADNNVTNNNIIVRIYVLKDPASPSDGSELAGVFGYRGANTNTSGHIGIEQVLTPGAAAGDYDIIIDVGDDGKFNSSKDFIDSGSAVGFTIKAIPAPSIAFSIGGNNSASHTTNYGDNNNSVMMQMKVETGSEEEITITSLEVRAFGTGNDKDGISLVSVYTDIDADGKIGQDDRLIGFEKFAVDDSIANIGINYVAPSNMTKYFLIAYKMSNKTSNGQTYYFEITSAKTSVASGRKITVSGFVLKSATKTISGSPAAIVCSSYTENSTCSRQSACSWCATENKCKNTGESCSATSCTGTPAVSFVESEISVTAIITALSNCENKTVYLKEASCEGTTINSCSVTGSGCNSSFAKPTTNKNYSFCIYRDGNSIFGQTEQSYKLFSLSQAEKNQTKTSTDLVSFVQSNWILIIIIGVIVIIVIVILYFLLTPGKPSEVTTAPQP